MNTTVLVIGAGLSGVLTAYRLSNAGIDFQLVEARGQIGGRIQSLPFNNERTAAVDMGPSWFWPHQIAMGKLVDELQLRDEVYDQYSEGLSVIEYANGQLQRNEGGASMAGSYRIKGGMLRVVNTVVSRLDIDSIHLHSPVRSISRHSQGLTTVVSINGEQQEIHSQRVVMALPPRLAAAHIDFLPELPATYADQLKQTPTWMAAQAKFVAVYAHPFWREQGLSGDGFSQQGPLTEIHDASQDEDNAALFGFVGVPHDVRDQHEDAIKQAALEQLERMFGEQAANPLHVYYKDWAADANTCTTRDLNSSSRSGASFPISHWDERLVWAGSESASHSDHANGYLEGAVQAADTASDVVVRALSAQGKVY